MLRLLRIHHHFPAGRTQTTAADRHLWEKTRTWKGKSIGVEHVELRQRFPNYLQTKLKRDRQHFSVFLAASPKEVRLKEKKYFSPEHDCKAGPRRGSSGITSYLTRRFRRHFKTNLSRESDVIEPRVLTVDDLPVWT